MRRGASSLLVQDGLAVPGNPEFEAWRESNPPIAGASGPTLIAHTAAGSGNGTTVTTTGIDTTGATLILVLIDTYLEGGSSAFTDNKSNAWAAGNNGVTGIAYTTSSTPTVGAGHTFTWNAAGSAYPSICVQAWSGATGVGIDLAVTNASANGQSVQPGSGTPAQNGELIVTGAVGIGNASTTVDSGFVVSDEMPFNSGVYYGTVFAYLVQATAAAINPTLTTQSGGNLYSPYMMSFKPTAAAAPVRRPPVFSQAVMGMGAR